MKPRKLKKLLQGLAFGVCITPSVMSYAAQEYTLWGKADNYAALLKEFSLNPVSPAPRGLQLPVNLQTQLNTVQNLQFVSGVVDHSKVSHSRYNQYYRGLPVWGPQLIYHVSSEKTSVTGSLLKGIEQDIKDLNGNISLEQAKSIAIGKRTVTTINAEKIIYFNKNMSTKAILAYHITYPTRTSDGPAILSYMIDANNGKIIQQWNALPTAEAQSLVGQGPGGTDLGTGQYKYQFGQSMPGMNAFDKFWLLIQGNVCLISNPSFRVINLKNQVEASLPFELPVSLADETSHQLTPFVYYCSAPNYQNLNDNGYAPINHGASPVNDTAYFVRQTLHMLIQKYKVTQPIGTDLPIRVYTHLGSYDNAFACGTNCMIGSGITGPQQLVFGNGQMMFAPLTEGDVVAHEFGHLVTDHHANLTYTEQSGGMNEAFSDMTGMTLDDYIRTDFGRTWYKNGSDWNLGAAVSLNGNPLRYLSDPEKDGNSIGSALKYKIGMNPHFSSGVYNKAFYLLSISKGWTIAKAYQVMLDANMFYWTPNSNYETGACGVMQASARRGYDTMAVYNAFKGVEVYCSVSKEAMMEV